MADFFNTQLDFILFFYGLAFILLGAVAGAMGRASKQPIPWAALSAFGYLHGASEWFDLIALVLSDTPLFALARTALMTASFMALLEFGRLDAKQFKAGIPGRWIYVPLLAFVAFGWHLDGTAGANTFARYAIAFPGAIVTAAMFGARARRASHQEKRWLSAAAAAFVLYGVSAGLIVPNAPHWSYDVVNYDHFVAIFGMPVQIVRGVLACGASLCIWGYWGQRLIVEAGSVRYAKFQHRQFVWTLTSMGAILVAGWVLTQVLGDIYKRNAEAAARGDLNLIASRLESETAPTEGMVKALAGVLSVRRLAAGDPTADRTRVDDVLAAHSQASGASVGFILNAEGKAVASIAKTRVPDSAVVRTGQDFSEATIYKSAMNGVAGHQFLLRASGLSATYMVGYPVLAESGEVVGTAALWKDLKRFEADLKDFDRSFALIDDNGVVLVTNRPDMRFRTLWPLPPVKLGRLAAVYSRGPLNARPALKNEVHGSAWSAFDGERDYVQRRVLAHGDWSLVTWNVPRGIFASRVLGIIITLQMAIMALVYLIGRQRWMHDNVQLEKRFELEELARSLDKRAATDPLTGLFNRRKFDRSLATEILRAERYNTQLSLILFDIDHFKKVNDTFGHQAGDQVLIDLSRYVAGHIRNSDTLARWGGEEFVILSPGNSGPMACLFAGNLLAGIGKIPFAEVGSITCSFGVAYYQPGDTAETLLARADDALYRAKSNGRNRIELAEQPQAGSLPQMALPLAGTSPATVPEAEADTAANLTPIKAP